MTIVRNKLKSYFYTAPLTDRLGYTPIGTLLAGRGIVLPVFDDFRNEKDLLGNGLYSYADAAVPGHDPAADLDGLDLFGEKHGRCGV